MSNCDKIICINKVVIEIGIPITVSDVKVTCYNYCVSKVLNILAKELKDYLVVIWININLILIYCRKLECLYHGN